MRASVSKWTQNLHRELDLIQGTEIDIQTTKLLVEHNNWTDWEKVMTQLLAALQGPTIDVLHNVPTEAKAAMGTTNF